MTGVQKKENVSKSILHHDFIFLNLLHQVADKVFEWLVFTIKGYMQQKHFI